MSRIEWTGQTWNPIVGCSKVSPGCDNCYAEKMAWRLANMDVAGYDQVTDEGPHWNGATEFMVDQLEKPLKRKKPETYFVCSMSDLFHEDTPFEWIDRTFAVMALCPQHTFQILTKRPMRMLEYIEGVWSDRIHREIQKLPGHEKSYTHSCINWPLRNVWLGVTAEDQERADQRINILLKCPAVIRFVSVEPMLGPVEIPGFLPQSYADHTCFQEGLDWVICGGESGTGSDGRVAELSWIRYLRDQCRASRVPFFFKQWGCSFHRGADDVDAGWNPKDWRKGGDMLDGRQWHEFPEVRA